MEQRAVVDKIQFKAYTPSTITSKEILLRELWEARQRGYATERGELTDLTFCCAAPIFDYTGSVIAAISLADIAKEGENETRLAADLLAVAGEISRALGFVRE